MLSIALAEVGNIEPERVRMAYHRIGAGPPGIRQGMLRICLDRLGLRSGGVE